MTAAKKDENPSLNHVNLKKGTTTIAEYSTTDAALALLREKYAVVPDVNTSEGYELVKVGIKELTGLRTSLEAARKREKDPYLKAGAIIDAEAKRITAELVLLEDPMKTAKREVDERIERERVARVARLQLKVDAISAMPGSVKGKTSAEISDMIDSCGEIDTSHDFYDLTKEAAAAQEAAMDELTQMLTDALANERLAREKAELEQKLAEQRAEVKRQEEALAEQAQKLKDQQEAMELQQKQMRDQQAEMDRQQQALNDAQRDREQAEQLAAEQDAARLLEPIVLEPVVEEAIAEPVIELRSAGAGQQTHPSSYRALGGIATPSVAPDATADQRNAELYDMATFDPVSPLELAVERSVQVYDLHALVKAVAAGEVPVGVLCVNLEVLTYLCNEQGFTVDGTCWMPESNKA